MFVSKNNKTLKLVVNYQFLNDIIIKNRYFLLLIAKALNRLTSAVVFIKLNIKIFIINTHSAKKRIKNSFFNSIRLV